MVLLVLILLCTIIGISYAYWKRTVFQETSNIISSDCLEITLTDESDSISLLKTYPISDDIAENLTPYTFKITNTCSTSAYYTVNLEIMNDDNRLASEYVAVDFDNAGKKLLSNFASVTPTYSDNGETAVEARKLKSGTLEGFNSVTYTLKLWMDKSVTSTDSMNKNFTSKVTIAATQATGETLVQHIIEAAKTDTINLVSDDGTDDNNTRYIGSNPDNYLCFDEDCTNGIWRAIGVMNNMTTLDGEKSLVKIVRAYSIGNYAWSTYGNNYFGGGGTSDWSNGSLTEILNSSDWWTSNLANYTNLIESVTWNIGKLSYYAQASTIYTDERSSNSGYYGNAAATWTGKVGLIYPSDYVFATSGGDTGRDTCLSQTPYYWTSYSDCYYYNYLYNSSESQWTISPAPYTGNSAMALYSNGNIGYQQVDYTMAVRPSLYLVAETIIISGDGTSSSPWIIGVGSSQESSSSTITSTVSIPVEAVSYIKTLAESETTSIVTDDTDDANIRFIGADPDNYLCFDEDCTNGQWRVIGLMNNMETESNGTQNLIKIIRNESIGNNAWDTNNVNDWTTASLNTYLNDDWYDSNLADYDNLLESVVWKLGGYSQSSGALTSSWYSYERGTIVYSGRPTEWAGKLALMYPSDYGYATSGGETTDRATCLAKELFKWDSSSVSDCKVNDYLYDSSNWQWTLIPHSGYSHIVFIVAATGDVRSYYYASASVAGVRPVGYLKSNTQILGGEGTSDSPWIIG